MFPLCQSCTRPSLLPLVHAETYKEGVRGLLYWAWLISAQLPGKRLDKGRKRVLTNRQGREPGERNDPKQRAPQGRYLWDYGLRLNRTVVTGVLAHETVSAARSVSLPVRSAVPPRSAWALRCFHRTEPGRSK